MTTVSYPVRGSDHVYWVYETDAFGIELPEMQTGEPEYVSKKLLTLISDKKKPVTDVVIGIHGWNTKQDDNESMYVFNELFAGLVKDYNDFPSKSTPPNFLFIGVHWPSAVGAGRADELVDDEASFEDNMKRMDRLCQSLLNTDPPAANRMKKLLDTLSATAEEGNTGVYESTLHRKVEKVHHKLVVPDEDDSDSDDEKYEAAAEEAKELKITPEAKGGFYHFSKFIISNVLRRLENKVFGQFLQRSENLGENGLHNLLALLQEYAPHTTRFHLVAHSLGSPALCRALVGGEEKPHLLRKKVHSATFLQGALGSHELGEGNKFGQLTRGLCPVAGPIVITTSQTDNALEFYRFFHDHPIGHFGAVNVDPMPATVLAMEGVSGTYDFKAGELFNMIADKYIDKDDENMFAGSHLDIYGPEVMRMIRQAMDVEVRTEEYALPTEMSKEFFKERFQIDVQTEPVAVDASNSGSGGDGKEGDGNEGDGWWGCVVS